MERLKGKNDAPQHGVDHERILIVGGDHANTLASMRALSEGGIAFDLMVHCPRHKARTMVGLSKHSPAIIRVEESYDAIKKGILGWIGCNDPTLCIILPSSDLSALVVDQQIKRLGVKTNGFLHSDNSISYLMDKHRQANWVAAHGVSVPKGIEVNLNDVALKLKMRAAFPIIIKPIVSAEGEKSDITKCDNEEDFELALRSYIKAGYSRALVQEFVHYQYELGCIGVVKLDGRVIWRAYRKEIVYPAGCGSIARARLEDDPLVLDEMQQVVRMLSSEGYRGPFDIDLFKTCDGLVLNEINFRQSGVAAFTFYENIYMPLIWVDSLLGKAEEKLEVTEPVEPYTALVEDGYLYHLKETGGSVADWFRELRKPGAKTLIYHGDNIPFLYFILQTALNQVKRVIGK